MEYDTVMRKRGGMAEGNRNGSHPSTQPLPLYNDYDGR